MRKILLFAVLSLPLLAQAGDDDKKKKKDFFENTYVGLNWGPDFYIWKDKASAGSTGYSYYPQFSQTLGLEFVKGVSEKVLISVGLQNSVKAFERTDECLTCPPENTYTPVSVFKTYYTQVPVSAYFLLSNSRLDVIGILGVNNSFFRQAKQEMNAYDGSTQHFSPNSSFRKYMMTVNAGVGFNYNVNLHFSWGMNVLYHQPIIKDFYSSGTKYANDPAVKMFGFGLNTSVYYKF